jgi:hypothetical protein
MEFDLTRCTKCTMLAGLSGNFRPHDRLLGTMSDTGGVLYECSDCGEHLRLELGEDGLSDRWRLLERPSGIAGP